MREIEFLADAPEPCYTTKDINQAYKFDSREEAEAVLKTLGLDFEIVEIPDEKDKQ